MLPSAFQRTSKSPSGKGLIVALALPKVAILGTIGFLLLLGVGVALTMGVTPAQEAQTVDITL